MPLYVMFQPQTGLGHVASDGIGKVRAVEAISAGGTGSLTALEGEIALLLNTEDAALIVAHGGTPDSAATASTPETSAAYPVPAGIYSPVKLAPGDKFSVAS